MFSALEVSYDNALYKFTFDIDIDIDNRLNASLYMTPSIRGYRMPETIKPISLTCCCDITIPLGLSR